MHVISLLALSYPQRPLFPEPCSLNPEPKLLAWLSAHLRDMRTASRPASEPLLDELTGAWADTPDGFSDAVLAARSRGSNSFAWE